MKDDKINTLQLAAQDLMGAIISAQQEAGRGPGGRELALCITKLEELVDWAERARWRMTGRELACGDSRIINETGGRVARRNPFM